MADKDTSSRKERSDLFKVDEAHTMGLVTEIVPIPALPAASMKLAERQGCMARMYSPFIHCSLRRSTCAAPATSSVTTAYATLGTAFPSSPSPSLPPERKGS